jgi:hypothetical protein
MNQTVETKTEEYRCDHCKRSFVRPNSLLKHLCEQKRRWQDRDRPQNRIAFSAWLKFYQQLQPSKKKREYTDFIASAYYGGFVKYGIYCCEVGVVNPNRYIDYLLSHNVPLDNWNSDSVYTKFLIQYLREEDGMDAVRRTLMTLLDIAEEENIQLRDVFRYCSANKLCHKIVGGKISPWVLYKTKSGQEFLSKLNEDQTTLIIDYIDPERWNIKMMRDKGDLLIVTEILRVTEL